MGGAEGRGRQGRTQSWYPELAPAQMKRSSPRPLGEDSIVICYPRWLSDSRASPPGSSRSDPACREPGTTQRKRPQCVPAPPGVPAGAVLSSVSFAAGRRKVPHRRAFTRPEESSDRGTSRRKVGHLGCWLPFISLRLQSLGLTP